MTRIDEALAKLRRWASDWPNEAERHLPALAKDHLLRAIEALGSAPSWAEEDEALRLAWWRRKEEALAALTDAILGERDD